MSITRVARLLALGGIAVVTWVPSSATAQERVADAQGNMHVPSNYQTSYEYLGS